MNIKTTILSLKMNVLFKYKSLVFLLFGFLFYLQSFAFKDKSESPSASDTIKSVATLSSFTTITWGTAASQLYGTHEVHGDVVNSKLYIFGGYDAAKHAKNPPQWSPTKRSSVYDPSTNTWANIADLPYIPNGPGFGGITHEGLATDGTNIYFAGGYKSNSNGTGQVFGTKQVWRYNVAANTYTAMPNLPIELATGQLRYLNGKLHYMGGANIARRDTSVHYALDLNNLSAGWRPLAPLLNGTNHPGSAVYNGKIYYLGGSHHQDAAAIPQQTVEVYDPIADKWTRLADMPTPRDHISSAVIVVGNRILVLGGETSHNAKSNLISAYSPDSNTWEELSPLPVAKAAGVAAFINNVIYYTGGNFSTTNYKGIPNSTTSGQTVQSFTLINADTEQPIQTLTNNTSINLATLPTKNLNIRANTNPGTVGSVMFNLTGTQSKTVTESISPYALFGDDNHGNYYAWTPAVGNYTLKATPYSGSKATGTQGTSLTVSFTVTNTAVQNSLSPVADVNSSTSNTRIYPNPVHDKLNIEMLNGYNGLVNLQIVDANGRINNLGNMKPLPGTNRVEIDISRLSLDKGIYYLRVSSKAGQKEITKFVIE